MYKEIKDMVLDGATFDEVINSFVDGEPSEEETNEIKSAYDRAVAEIDGNETEDAE